MNQYIEWTSIPHFYTGLSVVFFFLSSQDMMDFIDQELAFGKFEQFAVRFGDWEMKPELIPEQYRTGYWQLSTQSSQYLEKKYA